MRRLRAIFEGVFVGLLLLSGASSMRVLAQQCGGEERWPVKVGSDVTAATIDTAPVTTSLHNLIGLTRPTLPSDDTTRLMQERTVRTVDGRLVRFKRESGRTGDDDYHLVITDETLQFSPGGSGTTPIPHSFVAEIVNPNCVPGRLGPPATTSHFATQLQQVYNAFHQQFPNITGGWNTPPTPVPVTVTGVTFYDRQHNQTGRAMNGVEIHPVLAIAFNTVLPVAPLGPVMANADFEAGVTGWTATAQVITPDNREPARSGAWKAWLGGWGEPHPDMLWQQVTIPGNVNAATLEFYLHISTEEQANEIFDRLRVRVRDANGQFIATLRTYTNLQAAPGYAVQAVSLNNYRGRTIRVEFASQEDQGSQTSFVVDDFRIIVE